MKRIVLTLFVLSLVSIAAPRPAAAQDGSLIVKVPFQFIAGDKVLPAGTYRIEPQTMDWWLVRVTNLERKAPSALVVADTPVLNNSEDRDVKVKFTSYHGQYFLQRLSVPGLGWRQVSLTPGEAVRTLAKLNLLGGQLGTPAK